MPAVRHACIDGGMQVHACMKASMQLAGRQACSHAPPCMHACIAGQLKSLLLLCVHYMFQSSFNMFEYLFSFSSALRVLINNYF